MKIQTGHRLMKNVKEVAGKSVEFIVDEDRIVFSVTIGADGRSLEVRACDSYKVEGIIYSTSLVISPNVSNSITISTKPYDK